MILVGAIVRTPAGPAKVVTMKGAEVLVRTEPRVLVDKATGKEERIEHKAPWSVYTFGELAQFGNMLKDVVDNRALRPAGFKGFL